MEQNKRGKAEDSSDGCYPAIHVFEYRAGMRERQARPQSGCLVSQLEGATAAGFGPKCTEYFAVSPFVCAQIPVCVANGVLADSDATGCSCSPSIM